MFDNTLHIPLRFYNQVEKQDRFKPYVTTRRFTQYTDSTHLPPFQISIVRAGTLTSLKLVNVLTLQETTVTTGSDFYIEDFNVLGVSYAIYDKSTALSAIPYGDYYLKATFSVGVYYSEVFTVNDITGKSILTWRGTNDIGGIDYTNTGHSQFSNNLVFDCTLAKPEYIIEEEAVEDGDGNQLMTFQRSVKLFKFWFYGPEYIADALALVSLHDVVQFTTYYGLPESETGTIYDFAMSAEWQETKGLAKITCEFRDSPIIKTTCANNLV
jgi:hypothetical protein